MKIAFDTDVAIEIMRRRRPHYRTHLRSAQDAGASLHMSSVVFHELMFGAMASDRPEHQMEKVEQFAGNIAIESWTATDAMAAARLRADLRKSGTEIGSFDALIAGHAINAGCTLVTGNIREFIRIAALPILYWGDPAGPLDRAALMRLGKPR